MSNIRNIFSSKKNPKDQELKTFKLEEPDATISGPNLYTLHPQHLTNVFSYLSVEDQKKAKQVCYTWNLAINPKSAILNQPQTDASQSKNQPVTVTEESASKNIVLPEEVMLSILNELSANDLARASKVSRNWHRIASDQHLWTKFFSAHIAPQDKTKKNYGDEKIKQRERLANLLRQSPCQIENAKRLLKNENTSSWALLLGNVNSHKTQVINLSKDKYSNTMNFFGVGTQAIEIGDYKFNLWASTGLSQYINLNTSYINKSSIVLVCPTDPSEINMYANQIASSDTHALVIFVIRAEDQFELGMGLPNKIILEKEDTKESFFPKMLAMIQSIAAYDTTQQKDEVKSQKADKSCRIS